MHKTIADFQDDLGTVHSLDDVPVNPCDVITQANIDLPKVNVGVQVVKQKLKYVLVMLLFKSIRYQNHAAVIVIVQYPNCPLILNVCQHLKKDVDVSLLSNDDYCNDNEDDHTYSYSFNVWMNLHIHINQIQGNNRKLLILFLNQLFFLYLPNALTALTKHERCWNSQPFVNETPLGNLLILAAILYTGSLPAKALHILQALKCATIIPKTYFRQQKRFLHPAVNSVYTRHQTELVRSCCNRELILAGDGRADSPGHSAKFGSYTVIDLDTIGNSNRMEKEGLLRVMNFFKKKRLKVGTIITDKHCQINKWLRENIPKLNTTLMFGTYQKVSKRSYRSLEKQKIVSWFDNGQGQSSSVDGNPDEMEEKWATIDNHIHNVHRSHGKIFKKCIHRRLTGKRKMKRFKRQTKVSKKLSAILLDKNILKTIRRLSPKHQTSALESFHSVILHFAPKLTAYLYCGMKSRLMLAALHFNENANRLNLKRKMETSDIVLHIRKYIEELLDETVKLCKANCTSTTPQETPPSLCAYFTKPNKMDVIKEHKSRFLSK
uniref:Uncharacterized protein n=1 Tax=Amphimedon queenslandica TaxID=400682 RepID=A0A1X7TYQ2_AMPQE